MTYTEVNAKIRELTRGREDLKSKYEIKDREIVKKLDKLTIMRSLIEDGLNEVAAELGVEMIEMTELDTTFTKECLEAIERAINDIRNGAPNIRKSRYGVKRYEGWNSQTCDCEYGMVPTHGTLWFSVGLQKGYRKDLSDQEKIAAIQYLNLKMKKIRELKFELTRY